MRIGKGLDAIKTDIAGDLCEWEQCDKLLDVAVRDIVEQTMVRLHILEFTGK